MDHLISPSTLYPKSGSLPLLSNHWISQLMCLWPGFIFAVTYQVCCTCCKIIHLLLYNLIKKKLLSRDPQYPFPPGSHSTCPLLLHFPDHPRVWGDWCCEIFSCSHLLLRNPNVGQNPGSSLLVYESFGSSETFLTCKMEMEEMDVHLQGSNKIAGLMVIYVQMSRASLWSFWIRQSEARTLRKFRMEGTRPGQHQPLALGLTDTAAAVTASPVLPRGQGRGRWGRTLLPKAYVVA